MHYISAVFESRQLSFCILHFQKFSFDRMPNAIRKVDEVALNRKYYYNIYLEQSLNIQLLPMAAQTRNRTHVCTSNWNIRYILISTLKHGTHGTNGTLNVSAPSMHGCLAIIVTNPSNTNPSKPKPTLNPTETPSNCITCKTLQNTIAPMLYAIIPKIATFDVKLSTLSVRRRLNSCQTISRTSIVTRGFDPSAW